MSASHFVPLYRWYTNHSVQDHMTVIKKPEEQNRVMEKATQKTAGSSFAQQSATRPALSIVQSLKDRRNSYPYLKEDIDTTISTSGECVAQNTIRVGT